MESAFLSYCQSQKQKRNTVLEIIGLKKFNNTAKGIFFPMCLWLNMFVIEIGFLLITKCWKIVSYVQSFNLQGPLKNEPWAWHPSLPRDRILIACARLITNCGIMSPCLDTMYILLFCLSACVSALWHVPAFCISDLTGKSQGTSTAAGNGVCRLHCLHCLAAECIHWPWRTHTLQRSRSY